MSKKSKKSEELRQFMEDEAVDAMNIVETNVNWSKVRSMHTLWERTKAWFEHRRIAVSYNMKDGVGTTRRQQGGTATILRNKIAHKNRTTGFDKEGLGRWSWTTVTGKQGCVTRIVTVYCPVKTGKGNTIYTQQLRVLQEDPTKRFWRDLGNQILEWKAKGEQLIISGDWNEDVTGHNITEWMALFNLKELVTSLHEGRPPPTFNRGRDPIDGIFGTANLEPTAAGYLAFDHIPGDHRGVWVDLPNTQILGYKMQDIPRHKARRLKLDDPRVVGKYLRLLHTYFKTHDIYERVKRLQCQSKTAHITVREIQKEYEAIDKLREKGMHYAERRCRKLKMGGVPWSPKIKKARDTILFWTLVIKYRKKCHVSVRRILRLKKRLKIQGETKMGMKDLQEELNGAYTKYKKLKKKALDERLNYQEALAQAKAETNDADSVKVLRDLQHRETTRRTYRQIGSAIKDPKCSTTKIHIRTTEGIKEITQMITMEKYIMEENEEKFHQTEGWSPLLQGQLAKDIGLFGEGPKVQDILDGNYRVPDGYHPSVQRWIDTLKMGKSQQQQARVTLQDYQNGWKMVKEKTSSGELHFGHFKAGAGTSDIGRVHYSMSMIPMKVGFTPTRWRLGTDVMILKAPNVYLLDKLRTIVLYEADFNHENRRLGKMGMDMAITQDKIAPEQFSRPGRSAQDNALGKRLVFDHFRFLKKPFAMCSCDLKSCYDRVVHSAASLALQRVGVSPEALRCMFGTIQNMVHRIRTAYGTSRESFGGKSTYTNYPQGLGQGNGAGPTIWSILSSTVFESLNTQGYSTVFCSALSLGLMRLCGFSYVDDSDLISAGVTVEDAYSRLQSTLDEWDHLMQVNGAAMAPDKCWWYLVDFEWKNGKWKYVSPCKQSSLQVRNKQGEKESLIRLEHSQSKEMVGVTLAPNGNHLEQTKVLRQKTQRWAQRITKSPIDRDETWIALKDTISKTVEYPLAATTLTQSQLTHIMAPALTAGLPRANIARSFPRDVVYGPVSMQGLGLTDPYVFQYCRHVQDIVTQSWRQTEIGQLIQGNLEAAKLEIGVYGSIFDCSINIRWVNTTDSWILETQKFCQKHKICFDEPSSSLSPNCEGDLSIMEAMDKTDLTQDQLTRINNCRLYCRVVSLSDITDGYGKNLMLTEMERPVQWQSLNDYIWPNQGIPTQADWDLWLKALQSCFTHTGSALQLPLGKWKEKYLKQSTRWQWYTDNESLFQRTQEGWNRYDKMSRRHGKYNHFQVYGKRIDNRPERVYRTRVRRTKISYMSTGTRQVLQIPQAVGIGTTLYEAIQNVPDRWVCSWVAEPENLRDIVSSIQAGCGLGISDGSYKKNWDLCSAGWVLWTPEGEIKGGGTIPGPIESSTSYRGELGGILGLIIVIRALEILAAPVKQYYIKIGCDGLSALSRSMLTTREYSNTTHKDYDLISRIISYREGLKATFLPMHVKGHQDLNRSLSRAAVLNHRMDTLAKELNRHAYTEDISIPDALPPSHFGITQVDYDGTPIVSELARTLVNKISGDRLKAYWKRRGRYTEEHISTWIDWKVMSRMMREASHRRRIFISKWVSNQISVGTVMLRRSERHDDKCPCCKKQSETRIHLLRCRAAKHIWKKSRQKFKKWMRRQDTDPDIQTALVDILRTFQKRDDYDSYVPKGYNASLQRCLNAQSHIGITNMMEGMLTYDWAEEQQKYYTSIRSRKTGHRWAVGLSTQLWNIIYDMWDHRNQVLHQKKEIESLSGQDIINAAIKEELRKGLGTLDPMYYSYFNINTKHIANMKSVEARNWLVLIRRAREAKGFTYHDRIAESKALQKWIGLTIQKKDKQIYLRLVRTGYND